MPFFVFFYFSLHLTSCLEITNESNTLYSHLNARLPNSVLEQMRQLTCRFRMVYKRRLEMCSKEVGSPVNHRLYRWSGQ